MLPAGFHPITDAWFSARFKGATEPQKLGWPEILAGRHTLIAAPTGSGKTLSAFLVCIDRLLRAGLAGELTDQTKVVYISPLKALGNDVHRNLEVPLAEIHAQAGAAGYALPPIRSQVRTGDTPAGDRQKMARKPPHILVTTPESLYILLTSVRAREKLRSVETVIVDEIHALARDKRGSHLSLSLARLDAMCASPPVRIGLSATQRPIDEIAQFLVGANNLDAAGRAKCSIVDVGHARDLDLGIEVPPSPLSAVCSNEIWAEIYQRITDLVNSHRSTVIFVNTRRMAERVGHHLEELLGEDAVASHHGSLSRDIRLSAEQRLQRGELKAIVATASLELGIDVGYIDLVCQLGSPRAIATFLQRVGRSGHSLGLVPKGRLLPLSRDELLECLALIRAVRGRRLDKIEIPRAPLDILAQQIIAAVSCDEWQEDELFAMCRAAWPYRELARKDFDEIIQMLSQGIARGHQRSAYLHRDAIHRRLRARRGARLTAITSGGAIPESGDYRVVTEGDRTFVGTVNEDFAIESLAGDIFQLGNTSWRVRQVRMGEVVVNDAEGLPATIPFWLGEAPGRTRELSAELSDLRAEIAERATRTAPPATDGHLSVMNGEHDKQSGVEGTNGHASPAVDRATVEWLMSECGATEWAAEQAIQYVTVQKVALGLIPSNRRIVFERFFDESGGMQLVIHSPLGMRINKAWGLTLRKRFCRSFDFELQASADDNGIVLSLGPQHSFAIDSLFRMLNRENAQPLLIQALLAVPLFGTRWRWNATRALAILRQRGGKRVPAPLQRMRSDDLLAAVFPMASACLENVTGDIEVPDHPLVRQTVYDCLHEAMDVDHWLELIGDIETGRVELIARDTREPSPFSHAILNANPYAFLDDAPLEERRARMVATRRTLSPEDAQDLAWLDPEAIARVKADAWPVVRDADELHDVLLSAAAIPVGDAPEWQPQFNQLVAAGRATTVQLCGQRLAEAPDPPSFWIAAENLRLAELAWPGVTANPPIALPDGVGWRGESQEATLALVRGKMDYCGPTTAPEVAEALSLRTTAVEAALELLEAEGSVLRGQFRPQQPTDGGPNGSPQVINIDSAGQPAVPEQRPIVTEWCDRRLLSRIHRLTLDGVRRQVRPVEPHDFWRFLIEFQHLGPDTQLIGRRGAHEVVGQLQGFELPAAAWERDILPGRVAEYDSDWLDELSLGGDIGWGRLQPPQKDDDAAPTGSKLSRVVPMSLFCRTDLNWLLPPERGQPEAHARSDARAVWDALASHGALFPQDLLMLAGLLPAQLDEALSELAALGLVTSDNFANLRQLAGSDRPRISLGGRRALRRKKRRALPRSGRWSRFPAHILPPVADRVERWAWQLLKRYGVVFRDLLARESVAPAWGALAPVYRRLEARGKIRGGRFVSGVGGEQFATPEAVDQLRRVRESGPQNKWMIISATDPLNLVGILTPGPRLPAVITNALALLDGRVVAWQQAGELRLHEPLPLELSDAITRALRMSTIARARAEQAIAEARSVG